MKTIENQLKLKDRLLLKVFNTYAYYCCEIAEMQQKVLDYMNNTGAYALIIEFNETNQYRRQEYIQIMDKQITEVLNSLLRKKSITLQQWKWMKINRWKMELSTLYFLPDTHTENVTFHPMTICHYSLTIRLSRCLRYILRPIYKQVAYKLTFETGADAIHAVAKYAHKNLLRSTTLFATIHIHDLFTIFPHEQTLELLQRFLFENVLETHINGIANEIIIELVRLFLNNQYILHENKLYKQIRGSHFKSPMTTLLADIYIYYWQQDLVKILHDKNEVFGRHFNEIFMTWNGTEDSLRHVIDTINRTHGHLRMTVNIHDNINYLDANISFTYGKLKTKVARNLNTDAYSLPYVYGHRRFHFLTLLHAALIRATQCCSELFEFINECNDLQISFQYNGFDNNYFTRTLRLFLQEFHIDNLKIQSGEVFYDPNLYQQLRRSVFDYVMQLTKNKHYNKLIHFEE
ncbi:unnamed protein product [Adineta steineri]|uniref:Reverse transcriptase domain-containing protein n=1 Tax=Adineta steineri TaxID=433720 RepID=A0A815GC36_9BILA|nr:unnamed protein product [Adineta steineri]CAF3650178.1 unnamed protein product [Adineta steineri]